jgi:hypothetical protein
MLGGAGRIRNVRRAWLSGIAAVVVGGLAFGADEEASRKLAAVVERGDAAQVVALVG